MELVRGKSAQRIDNILVCHIESLFDRLALNHLSCHRARGNRAAAAEGLKLHVFNFIVLDLEIHLHDVAALGVADFAHAVRVLDASHISRVHEVIHHNIGIKCHSLVLLIYSINCFSPRSSSFHTGDMLRR